MKRLNPVEQLIADLRAHWWNFRWNFRLALGWRILPGSHKHVDVYTHGSECDRCQRASVLKSMLEQARRLV